MLEANCSRNVPARLGPALLRRGPCALPLSKHVPGGGSEIIACETLVRMESVVIAPITTDTTLEMGFV